MKDHNKKKQATIAVQASIGADAAHNAVIPPLYLSSTYRIEGLDARGAYEYSRTRNPSRDALSSALAELEGGTDGVVTSSGMAALTLILHLLGPDDMVVAPFDCYGRSYFLLRALAEKKHFRLEFIDPYNAQNFDAIFALKPKMVILETPSNPVMRICDIAAIAARAQKTGALTVVDNTFLSPVLQRPLQLGADIVYHSTTKFINGHSDIVGGAVITNSEAILKDLNLWNNSLGTVGAPFDSYMTLRGLRTLDVRVRRASENAAALAAWLERNEMVETVFYPGLPAHPGHDVAKKQQDGFGAMLSFTLKGPAEQTARLAQSLDIFCLAQSLGGTESLVCHPASMTHVSMGAEARTKAGVTDQLLRLSVGIEHIDDLIADLEQGFEKIKSSKAA